MAGLDEWRRRARMGTGRHGTLFCRKQPAHASSCFDRRHIHQRRPEPLFEQERLVIQRAAVPRYAISTDGTKFLVVESEPELTQPVMRIVENWLSEFRAKQSSN
jgi:hypothetical protein